MQPRLNISFSLKNQWAFWFGQEYLPQEGEYLLNHARSGIVMALRTALPEGGRVGVVAYNCHTVANAVVEAGCTPVFVDVTEELKIDIEHLAKLQIEAMIVTNLFGIHNNLDAIRQAQPNAVIIVDNAHGYGLPAEGDFTVYSINQGKFPALGEGGILWVNNKQYLAPISQQYEQLVTYTLAQELKLFVAMLVKALLHTPLIYSVLTIRAKQQRKEVACGEKVRITRMAKGVRRMYNAALPNMAEQIERQKENAQDIAKVWQGYSLGSRIWWGENAFMLIACCDNPKQAQAFFAQHGVDTATHFVKSIEWAKQFGYAEGTCPTAERLTKELLMIPTYKKINL